MQQAPELLENVNERILSYERRKNGNNLDVQASISVNYDSHEIGDAFKDLIVEKNY